MTIEGTVERDSLQVSWRARLRLVLLSAALVNSALASVDLGCMDGLHATLLTAVMALWCYWKNNSWTEPAIFADRIMEQAKEVMKQ